MPFQDGLGERQRSQEVGGGSVDVLSLRRELAGVPSFEFALRERVSRLASFQHPAFGRVRGVERASGSGAEATLKILSDHTPGLRLSDILAATEEQRLPIEIGVALSLIRQLVSGVAVLHETARDAGHGAIAPERLVVTPNARLVIVEYVLGSALEQLLFSRERYWTELRVALPRVAGLPHFDHLTDATQIGVVALSLIHGRRLRDDEYPGKLLELVASAMAVADDGSSAPVPVVLRQWLERALQLDPRLSFASAIEARTALDRVVSDCGFDTSPAKLEAWLARYRQGALSPTSAAAFDTTPSPLRALHSPPSSSLSPEVAPSLRGFPVGAPLRDSKTHPPVPKVTAVLAPPADPWIEPLGERSAEPASRGWRSGVVAAAVVGAVIAGSGATMAARRFFPATPVVATSGSLSIATVPPGAHASIDGAPQGVTPLTVSLSPGRHTLSLRGSYGERNVLVTIVAGAQVSQFIDLPKETAVAAPPPETLPLVSVLASSNSIEARSAEDAPLAGWVAVAGRFDVQLFEQGRLLGTSESDRIMVGAGHHELELVNDELGYRSTRSVEVAAGKVAAIALEAPKGMLALNALPWAEVTVDGEAVGDTPLGNLSLPIGAHDVLFRHPDLGEQRYRVAVTLKAPARLSVDLRKP